MIGPAAGAKAKSVLRRHWVFAGLVVLAAALRGVVLVAYQPALIFPDSVRYLQYAHNFTTGHWSPDALRQSGYSVAIIPVVLLHALWLLPLLQHLAGLVTAGLVYAVLIRSGARPGLAAVAAVPVLFDPLQLVLEQYVLTDIGAALLIMAALVILAWRRDGPRPREAAATGLLLGAAVTFRDQDLIMIVPAALYLLVAVRPASRLLTRLAATAGCFLVPVVGYLGWFAAAHGQWNFTTFDGAFLYGRVADFADCRGLALPADEQPLCPAAAARAAQRGLLHLEPAVAAVDLHPSGREVEGRGGARLQPADPAAPAARLRRSRRPRPPVRLLPRPRRRPGAVLPRLPAVQHVRPARPGGLRLDRETRLPGSVGRTGSGRLPDGLRAVGLPARPGARGRPRAGPGRAGREPVPRPGHAAVHR